MEDVNEVKDIKHPAIKGVLQWLHWEEGLERVILVTRLEILYFEVKF
jgi:hypothetical protein